MRVFIAVELPEKMRKEAAQLQSKMGITADRIKWVNSGAIHITLKFLGEVEEKKLKAVYRATEDTARKWSPFLLGTKGVGAFPEDGNPKVIWMGIEEGSAELSQMAAQLEEKLFSYGFPREHKKWTPHITLGRVKQLEDRETLTKLIAEEKQTSGGTARVKEVTVMQSRLTPRGALYAPLQRFSLKGE